MNTMMAGMFPTMVFFMMGRDMRAMDPRELLYWGVMSLAISVGFFTAYPMNWWLVTKDLKHGLMTVRQTGRDAACTSTSISTSLSTRPDAPDDGGMRAGTSELVLRHGHAGTEHRLGRDANAACRRHGAECARSGRRAPLVGELRQSLDRGRRRRRRGDAAGDDHDPRHAGGGDARHGGGRSGRGRLHRAARMPAATNRWSRGSRTASRSSTSNRR